MTEKENYMKLARGEMPEWVPVYSFGPRSYRTVPTVKIGCPPLEEHNRGSGLTRDVWGAPYVSSDSVGAGKMPKPGDYILKDICDWRSVIKAPDFSDYDWKAIAKKQMDNLPIDRKDTAVIMRMHMGYFQMLISFMGFEEACISLVSEQEECEELFNYMSDFYIDVFDKYIDCVRPDMLCITDDQASEGSLFFSLDIYRRLFKPLQTRQAELALKRGIPIEMHCCGKCELLIDEWMDFGVNVWQTAQTSNNLRAIKEKYGRSLALCGCWNPRGRLLDPDCPEEEVRAYVRQVIDEHAPGGGFVFYGHFLSAADDTMQAQKTRWAEDEAEKYGKHFYR